MRPEVKMEKGRFRLLPWKVILWDSYYCLTVRTFEDSWVGMDGIHQQVFQKTDFGSHLRDEPGSLWESPGESQ